MIILHFLVHELLVFTVEDVFMSYNGQGKRVVSNQHSPDLSHFDMNLSS